ncbi:hypothetical protein [Gordonia phage GTE5]|uniref:Uncharacterized protein n=2 Tax=Gruunavirus TaxID=2948731 RepID=A0A386K9S5_9CAUD|nr:hypothetical protein GoPhGTE5p50 [Gordonia phage GTE5]YP_010098765.1 hypothetical protein KNU13_gp65 [Gordonia phage Turuncu]AET09799.1 hypothetical protein [Gordonia phage GTE5]AYD82151.1 hypothetical protein SEA_TURUNCU_65 [Gordonia phage Turuncu]
MIERHLRCTPDHVQCSIHHARLVDEYRQERYRQEIEREEDGCSDYPEEMRKWAEEHDMITFKKWLIGSRGASWA